MPSYQQLQINNKFSSKSAVIYGVLQASIDWQLHFNLFINDLYLILHVKQLC